MRVRDAIAVGLALMVWGAPSGAAPAVSPEGPIRKWVVLGPFPNPIPPTGRSAAARAGHDVDYLGALGGEAGARLKGDAVVSVAGAGDVRARTIDTADGHIDFGSLYADGVNKVAYAAAEVTASADIEALVYLGSDDGVKVWVNGKLVWDKYPLAGRAYTAREDRFAVRLRKGVNAFLAKVENGIGGWELGVEVLGPAAARAVAAEEARKQRVRESLELEVGPLRQFPGYVFRPGPLPAIGWRDPDAAKRLIGATKLRVRWFGPDAKEASRAEKPGRYGALVEGQAADGTPVRTSISAFCAPPEMQEVWRLDWQAAVPYLGRPFNEAAWQERAAETSRAGGEMLQEAVLTTERGAITLAGLFEAKAEGRPPRFVDTAIVRHADYQLALKRNALAGSAPPRGLAPPRVRSTPALVLHDGTPAEAGVIADAKPRIDAACRNWAADSGEPFSVLVARHGVIVTHAAFGDLAPGEPCTVDFRNEVASITKAISGMLFSQFVDQGIVAIDDPIGRALPGFPTAGPRTLTYRHCFTHTSGFEGHGNWGGIWNPHLENVLLRTLPTVEPGARHIYNGMGYDLAGKAMEMISGQSIVRLFTDHLFRPMGFEDVPINDMAFGARLTARELGALGQCLANQGSYGDKEFVSPSTFAKTLPRPLKEFWPAITVEWGIGLTHMAERRPGAPAGSLEPKDLSLGPKTIGHGSATSCILRVNPEQDLVIAMIRRTAGPRYDQHAQALFAAIADSIVR